MDSEQWLYMYEQMCKIRAFEEMANELYLTAKMPSLTHMYIGEEAIAVGVCEALRIDDYITSTHRGHGHCLAKGAIILFRDYRWRVGRPSQVLYRFHGHHVGDIKREYYRSKEEENYWKTERDPLKILEEWLTTEIAAASAIFRQIDSDVEQEIQQGVDYALNAPYPVANEVDLHVYA